MRLGTGGIDVFYIDESMDRDTYAMVGIAVPFLRCIEGTWTIVWKDQFDNMRDWRRRARLVSGVPVRKELKGSKFASGRGRYLHGKHQLPRARAAVAYRGMLADLQFLQDEAVISVIGNRGSNLYGHGRLEALLYALLQRMRTACISRKRNGFVFFDEGHSEYRTLYRKAQVFLPTGSMFGGWGTGATSKNLPLDNFTKDGNFKDSRHCFFTQLADLIAYAAFLMAKDEQGRLEPWQNRFNLGALYGSIPHKVLNTRANKKDPLGVVRL